MSDKNEIVSKRHLRGGPGFRSEPGVIARATILPPEDTADQVNRLAGLGLMSAGIVHDFGNLMQIIESGVRGMEQQFGSDRPPELLFLSKEVMGAASRASALTRRILDHSRGASVEVDFIDIGSVVLQMRTLIGWAAGPTIQVFVEVDPELPRIRCSPSELESAIINLVVNARHAMPDGGTVGLSVRGIGNKVALRVVDTGCGMSVAAARHACDPFFTSRPRAGGSGLGLAIVGAFVRALGGTISVNSTLGSGTAIELTFGGFDTAAQP